MSAWVVVRCDAVTPSGLLCVERFRTVETTIGAAEKVAGSYGWRITAGEYFCPAHAAVRHLEVVP